MHMYNRFGFFFIGYVTRMLFKKFVGQKNMIVFYEQYKIVSFFF